MHSSLDISPLRCHGQPAMEPRYTSQVRKYREAAGYSQERLARDLGVTRQTVANIERGTSEPKVLLALAIAALLGVALSELFRKGK